MPRLSEYRSYHDVIREFHWEMLWQLCDGTTEQLNIAHECVDRHDPDRIALFIQFEDGHRESYRFGELAELSGRVAHYLAERGVLPGTVIGLMLDPSLAFYATLFGILKRGAVAVPFYPLFGPDALRQRLDDCRPRLLVVDERRRSVGATVRDVDVVVADESWLDSLHTYTPDPSAKVAASDPAILQYTSGTSRQFPEAVRHRHRAVVTLALASLFGLGLQEMDTYFCPSSPAWGHGLWHGTIAPLALGIAVGAYSGRFSAASIEQALVCERVNNFTAAATVYRMLKEAGVFDRARLSLTKTTYTGEPIDPLSQRYIEERTGIPLLGMYGTTETGVILANYPGFSDFPGKSGAGALGRPVPGWDITVINNSGEPVGPDVVGEIAVRRRGQWVSVRDAGLYDKDGYFWYKGRADDVIISAGWTISAVEVEAALLQHPKVREVVVVGAADPMRGQVVKAVVVSRQPGSPALASELQAFVKARLSPHEYPRVVEFVRELPKTPAGKVDRHRVKIG